MLLPFLSLNCTLKPSHSQVDSLPDEENSEYTSIACQPPWWSVLRSVSLHNCMSVHDVVTPANVTQKSHDSNLIGSSVSQQNQGMGWSMPDPFPSLRVGSENKTNKKITFAVFIKIFHSRGGKRLDPKFKTGGQPNIKYQESQFIKGGESIPSGGSTLSNKPCFINAIILYQQRSSRCS